MHPSGMMMCVRTTLIIDKHFPESAREATGINDISALVSAGLEALISREAAKRLVLMGGSEPQLRDVPRRRLAR